MLITSLQRYPFIGLPTFWSAKHFLVMFVKPFYTKEFFNGVDVAGIFEVIIYQYQIVVAQPFKCNIILAHPII